MHIWIDGTRFLPDNCSITKIIVKIWDNNMKEQWPQQEQLADFGGTFKNQVYGLKIVIPIKKLRPTSILYIKFETFDQTEANRAEIVGHTYFPLYIDMNT